MVTSKQGIFILVIDDEASVRHMLEMVLSRVSGYHVRTASGGNEGLACASEQTPDLVILDILMEDMNGMAVCRELRNWYHGPILVLSVQDGERDKIDMLDLGADDFLTKPFSPGELLARVRALLRRAALPSDAQPKVTVGELVIDLARHRVTLAGADVKLTPMEYNVLKLLARNANCVVTYRQLLTALWGAETEDDMASLRVHISRLRHKLESSPDAPHCLVTEPCVGFRLKTE